MYTLEEVQAIKADVEARLKAQHPNYGAHIAVTRAELIYDGALIDLADVAPAVQKSLMIYPVAFTAAAFAALAGPEPRDREDLAGRLTQAMLRLGERISSAARSKSPLPSPCRARALRGGSTSRGS